MQTFFKKKQSVFQVPEQQSFWAMQYTNNQQTNNQQPPPTRVQSHQYYLPFKSITSDALEGPASKLVLYVNSTLSAFVVVVVVEESVST